MVRARHVGICALAIAGLMTLSAGATECVKQFSWKCADKSPNSCKGIFHGGGAAETFTESGNCNSAPPHELWQVLRFTGLPKGTHKVRTSYSSEDPCIGSSFGESITIKKRQASGCDETGTYVNVQTVDDSCCASEADYDLSASGTTDICLGFLSNQAYSGQDEFYMFNGAISAPAIVTTLDTEYFADSEQTSPGAIFSGNYTNTYISDNVREILQEGGINHQLFHVYEILQIPTGASQTLKVEGYRSNNTDGDNFAILYKWSATPCTTTGPYTPTGISIDSAAEVTRSAAIGNLSGRLCIAVDDTAGGSVNDKVNIDRIWVETASPVCP
ncbi:MAG TPA: hypothetical protein VFW45_09480 [Candidatus Polarisedimenticolia bacterium]|nr:hypothetical protein [Candidatus Polarisedimenticolia bacterium]